MANQVQSSAGTLAANINNNSIRYACFVIIQLSNRHVIDPIGIDVTNIQKLLKSDYMLFLLIGYHITPIQMLFFLLFWF